MQVQAGVNCCEPRTVFTAKGCADGVSWLRIIETQGANTGTRWLNLATNVLADTMPAGFTLGDCAAEATGAHTYVDTLDPNVAGTQFFSDLALTTADPALAQKPAAQYVAADGSFWAWNGVDQYELLAQIDKVKVKNPTASPIPKLAVVYIVGASGSKPEIGLADNTTEVTSSKTLGVVQAAIAANDTGWVVETGEVRGDTSIWPAGTHLWLGTAGGLTSTRPAAPAHAVYIGVVLEQGNNGRLFVNVQNGYELGELHDVDLTGAGPDDVLVRGADGVWRAQPPSPFPTFAKVVYINTVDPATATIFDDENPPVTNDTTLRQDDANLYVGSDGSTWVWNGTAYITKVVPAATEWMLAGTTTDAGADKTSSIYRQGRVLLATASAAETSPRMDLHVQAGGASAFAGFGNGMLFSTTNPAGSRILLEHLGVTTGRRMVVGMWHENGLTKFAGILTDDATAWVAENNLVVRNNGGPVTGAVGVRTATPVSNLDVGGSFGANIEKSTTPTQGMVANSHTYISQVGNNFVNLPAPSTALATSNIRRIYVVKRVPTATTPTVVQGHIDDVANASLAIQPGQARTFQCDGTTWWVI